MFANHPDIAKRWEDLTSNPGSLPEHVTNRKGLLRPKLIKSHKHRKHHKKH